MGSDKSKVSINWHQLPSGIVIPDGHVSSRLIEESDSFLLIKDKARKLEEIASKADIPIVETCDLAKYIHSAKELSDKWLCDKWEEIPHSLLHEAVTLNRVANALFSVESTPYFVHYLKKLVGGQLSPFSQNRSEPNDHLWEVELLSILSKLSILAKPGEPDLVATFEGKEIGVACKKIYSEENFEKVLSNGVGQIERAFDAGFVAIDLLPPVGEIRAKNSVESGELISQLNCNFIKRHERHFRKYLSSGRVLSAFVSTSAIVRLGNEQLLSSQRQSTLWSLPGLPPEKDILFRLLGKEIMG
jgi:hypothetical protein